jgi:hypothetical protein
MVKTKQAVGVTSYIAGQTTMGEIDANEHHDDEQEEGLMYSYSDFNIVTKPVESKTGFEPSKLFL